MDDRQFREFLKDQIEEIHKYVLQRNREAGNDITYEAQIEWIHENAATFRKEWNRLHSNINLFRE